jgi:hypothetical protein
MNIFKAPHTKSDPVDPIENTRQIVYFTRNIHISKQEILHNKKTKDNSQLNDQNTSDQNAIFRVLSISDQ